MRAALLAAALLVATAAPATAADTDYLIWDSDPGAWPTQGRSGSWTPPALMGVHEFPAPDNSIRIYGESANGWDFIEIRLFRHDGERIGEGHFEDQRVLVVNKGFGWYDDAGDFDVTHIAYDAGGRISEFDGNVEHHYLDQPNSTFRAKLSYRR
ncbi:hypothetical protein [Lentzea sp. CA-135723]|uniref:hypothetical protein n=1 Tax=Lentzea sp. CA-135723 TaxID=3239950 RepID=UPI003D8B5ADA